jgi:hypothetical protein
VCSFNNRHCSNNSVDPLQVINALCALDFYPTHRFFPRWITIGFVTQNGSNKKTMWLTVVSISKGILYVVEKSLKTPSSRCYC